MRRSLARDGQWVGVRRAQRREEAERLRRKEEAAREAEALSERIRAEAAWREEQVRPPAQRPGDCVPNPGLTAHLAGTALMGANSFGANVAHAASDLQWLQWPDQRPRGVGNVFSHTLLVPIIWYLAGVGQRERPLVCIA
jgi:hypothetical protein